MIKWLLGMVSLALLGLGCADYQTALDETPPESVALRITATTDSSVSLSWGRSNASDFKYYRVCYTVNGMTNKVQPSDKMVDSTALRFDTTLTVRNLAPLSHYSFAVFVYTVGGKYGPSNTVDTTIGLKASPIRVRSTLMGDTTVLYQWDSINRSDFKNYVYYSQTSRIDSLSLPRRFGNPSNTTFAYNRLDTIAVGKYLYVRVDVEYQNGSVTKGVMDSLLIKAKPQTLNADSLLRIGVSDVTDSTISLRWKRSTSPNITNYLVLGDTVAGKTLLVTLGATDSTYICKIPRKRAVYTFAVVVKNNVGLLDTSNMQSAWSLDSIAKPPALPDSVTVNPFGGLADQVDTSSFKLSWSLSPVSGARYIVCAKTDTVLKWGVDSLLTLADSATVVFDPGLLNKCTVKNLRSDCTYVCAVYVKTASGVSKRSNVVYAAPKKKI